MCYTVTSVDRSPIASRWAASSSIGSGRRLSLVALSTVIAILLTVPLAMIAALNKDGVIDLAIKGCFVVAMSMPSFWLGILLVLLFAMVLPSFRSRATGMTSRPPPSSSLPAFVIALATAALTIRSLRSAIIAVLRADYIDTAHAKGLPGRAVLLRHVFPNSLISTISVLGVHTSWIIGGTVVIESVFGIPGLGYLLVSSISARDYPMVQGLTVTFAMLVVIINL